MEDLNAKEIRASWLCICVVLWETVSVSQECNRGGVSLSTVSDQAFVTLATNDVYCQGALVLGQSLRNHMATRKLVVLITPQVSSLLR